MYGLPDFVDERRDRTHSFILFLFGGLWNGQNSSLKGIDSPSVVKAIVGVDSKGRDEPRSEFTLLIHSILQGRPVSVTLSPSSPWGHSLRSSEGTTCKKVDVSVEQSRPSLKSQDVVFRLGGPAVRRDSLVK